MKRKALLWGAVCLAALAACLIWLWGRGDPAPAAPPQVSLTAVTTPAPEAQAQPASPAPALPTPAPAATDDPKGNTESLVDQYGSYDGKEEVALYLQIYGQLPDNYITKDQAEDLGWNGGSVERYAPGKCIGGDTFSNREGLLPKANGRTWTECDIDTLGANGRGAKRIVYSNDGLIYYTDDHYETFEKIYP